MAHGSCLLPLVLSPDRLSRILHHLQVMLLSNLHDGVHVRTLSVKMDWDYRLGLGGDPIFYLPRVQIVGIRIDIYKHRGSTEPGNSSRSGEVGEGGRDNLISWSHSARPQGQKQCISARGDPHSEFRSAILGRFLLKSLYVRSHDKSGVGQD